MKRPRDDARSLDGRRILVTRASHQAQDWIDALEERGAAVELCPVLCIEAIAAEIPPLDSFDWVVITSPNGIGQLHDALARAGSTSWPTRSKLAVVGPATAAAAAGRGWPVSLQPERATGDSLAAGFTGIGLRADCRVLRVRGDRAPRTIETALTDLGAQVTALTLYRNVSVAPPAAALAALNARAIDAVTFASGSAVTSLLAAAAGLDLPTWLPAACLGPVTVEVARQEGWTRVAMAADPSPAALADAVEAILGFHR